MLQFGTFRFSDHVLRKLWPFALLYWGTYDGLVRCCDIDYGVYIVNVWQICHRVVCDAMFTSRELFSFDSIYEGMLFTKVRRGEIRRLCSTTCRWKSLVTSNAWCEHVPVYWPIPCYIVQRMTHLYIVKRRRDLNQGSVISICAKENGLVRRMDLYQCRVRRNYVSIVTTCKGEWSCTENGLVPVSCEKELCYDMQKRMDLYGEWTCTSVVWEGIMLRRAKENGLVRRMDLYQGCVRRNCVTTCKGEWTCTENELVPEWHEKSKCYIA